MALSAQEKSDLFYYLGRTDRAVLADHFHLNRQLEVAINDMTRQTEERVRKQICTLKELENRLDDVDLVLVKQADGVQQREEWRYIVTCRALQVIKAIARNLAVQVKHTPFGPIDGDSFVADFIA